MSEDGESLENENESTTTGIDKYKKQRKEEVKKGEPDAIASAD